MVVVFDSSPWIFLSRLGIIETALRLFNQVLIPSTVCKEIFSKRDKAARELEKLQKAPYVTVLEARNIRLVSALGIRLGRGEYGWQLKKKPMLLL